MQTRFVTVFRKLCTKDMCRVPCKALRASDYLEGESYHETRYRSAEGTRIETGIEA